MTHPLKNRIGIDVDDKVGLGNLAGVRLKDTKGGTPGRQIDVAFFEPVGSGGFAPRGTKAVLDEWRSYGPAPNAPAGMVDIPRRLAGLRMVPQGWVQTAPKVWSDPAVAARTASGYITALEDDGVRRVDVVEWDVETHDRDWQLKFLLGYTKADGTRVKGIRGCGGDYPDPTKPETLGYRWGRPGVWTMEGKQAEDPYGNGQGATIAEAARAGLLIGPQCYYGDMSGPPLDPWFEFRTWALNDNPERPSGAHIAGWQFLPYYDARRECRMLGISETVLFATSRLTELFE